MQTVLENLSKHIKYLFSLLLALYLLGLGCELNAKDLHQLSVLEQELPKEAPIENTAEITFEEELEGLPDAYHNFHFILVNLQGSSKLSFVSFQKKYQQFHPELLSPPPRK